MASLWPGVALHELTGRQYVTKQLRNKVWRAREVVYLEKERVVGVAGYGSWYGVVVGVAVGMAELYC